MSHDLLNSTIPSLEKQLHEEEVRYNEAFRMNAEFQVLKSIRQKIRQLKAELCEQTEEFSEDDTFRQVEMIL